MKSNQDEERQIPLEAHFLHSFSGLASDWFSSSELAHEKNNMVSELRSSLWSLTQPGHANLNRVLKCFFSLPLKTCKPLQGWGHYQSLSSRDSSPALSDFIMSLWIIERLGESYKSCYFSAYISSQIIIYTLLFTYTSHGASDMCDHGPYNIRKQS